MATAQFDLPFPDMFDYRAWATKAGLQPGPVTHTTMTVTGPAEAIEKFACKDFGLVEGEYEIVS